MRLLTIRFLVVCFVIAGATLMRAATVQRFTVAEMTVKADLIIQASITSSEAAWNAELTKIFTSHSLDIKDTLKGEAAQNQKAYTAGGVVNRKGQHVSGEARLSVGTEYVLFLWKDKDGRHRVLGMAQGAFTITRPEGEAATAKNSALGLTFVNAQGEIEKASAIDQTLNSLKGAVETSLPKAAKAADKPEGKAPENAEAPKAKDGDK